MEPRACCGTTPDCQHLDDCPERGRELANQRDDLIAAGVNPAELEIPLGPAVCECVGYANRVDYGTGIEHDVDRSSCSIHGTDATTLRERIAEVLPQAGFPGLLDDVMALVEAELPSARVEALIDASSLGTPEAKAARESVPREVGIAIARAAEYLGRAREAEARAQRFAARIADQTALEDQAILAVANVRMLCDQWDRLSKGESITTAAVRAALDPNLELP